MGMQAARILVEYQAYHVIYHLIISSSNFILAYQSENRILNPTL